MNTKSTIKHIVFLDRASLPARIKIPPPNLPHKWVNHSFTAPEHTINHCTNADVVISNKVKIDQNVLQACPTIKHIAVSATGYNIVDLDICHQFGVSVSNIPSYAATTVAEHSISCALNLKRELVQYREAVINGAWSGSSVFCLFDKPINNLRDNTFGILGFGEIGQATAKLADAIGMNVIYCSKHNHHSDFARQVPLPELLTSSDILSVHCSLNAETKNIIDDKEIRQMKDRAILINTARGGIVNEAAAVTAIQEARLGGLAFDVLVNEPPDANSPLLSIANHSNVIITPHIAWASEQAMNTLGLILSNNVDSFLNNRPQNIVH